MERIDYITHRSSPHHCVPPNHKYDTYGFHYRHRIISLLFHLQTNQRAKLLKFIHAFNNPLHLLLRHTRTNR